jgi:hypothetical protein
VSVKSKILYYLQTHPGWVSKPQLEQQSSNWLTGADNIDRRSRELAYAGSIEKRLSPKRTTEYRFRRTIPPAEVAENLEATFANEKLFDAPVAKRKQIWL